MNEMDQILMREHHLENETLSLKAKGLFSIMLLQEPTWNFTVRNLAELSRDGIEAVGNAVRELEKATMWSGTGNTVRKGISAECVIYCTEPHVRENRHRKITSRKTKSSCDKRLVGPFFVA